MHHNKISDRKAEHVEICLNKKTQAERNYWEDLKFIHHAIPELDLDSISTKTEILGMELTTPIIISAMTGGFKGAREINENLARAAAEFGIGFGIGSERAMLDDPDPEVIDSFKIVKAYKPRIKISNIGVAQLVEQRGAKPLGMDEIRYLIEIIDANALAIHLNYLQECMQLTETNSKGLLKVIEKIVEELDVPVIIKETGAGISFEVAEALGQIGVKCIDVGGLGGTSFAGVEYHRAKSEIEEDLKGLLELGNSDTCIHSHVQGYGYGDHRYRRYKIRDRCGKSLEDRSRLCRYCQTILETSFS